MEYFIYEHPPLRTVEESKALIDEFASLHKTDPVLKQADDENLAIPHASTLTESADEM